MKILFHKYHGAGNDFIAIDNRHQHLFFSDDIIAKLCDRRLGIGADGVIVIKNGDEESDFILDYYNSDGKIGSLCGNGSRCALAFAKQMGIIDSVASFKAFDGLHTGSYFDEADVRVSMNDVSEMEVLTDGCTLNTGSPHLVKYVSDIQNYNVYESGKKLRNDSRFPDGINVNFIAIHSDGIFVRTYERGVEDETLSCGTGVTASALVHALQQNYTDGNHKINVYTKGGAFIISFNKKETHFSHIILQGLTKFVFSGEIKLYNLVN
jgi:diaminopimelate epimerase